jgi:hypothetical protein
MRIRHENPPEIDALRMTLPALKGGVFDPASNKRFWNQVKYYTMIPLKVNAADLDHTGPGLRRVSRFIPLDFSLKRQPY